MMESLLLIVISREYLPSHWEYYFAFWNFTMSSSLLDFINRSLDIVVKPI